MLQMLSKAILKVFGWSAVSEAENRDKYILIGAPHTSNWDFPLTLLAISALGIRFSWVAKSSIFKGPAGYLFRRIGGISVNRNVPSGFLLEMTDSFKSRENFVVAIAPEGTRGFKDHWKSGFYNIARIAEVDIRLGYIDYPSKTVGLGPYLTPSEDINNDFNQLEKFYLDKTGKVVENKSLVRLRKKDLQRIQKDFEK
jgi:1-acyl-sn-glycerol-3-phosphate acyltransferase